MSELDPTQIRSQIKNFGNDTDSATDDPVFQACLFAALAREYDAHQDALAGELADLRRMERRMFENLAGGANDDEATDMAVALGAGSEGSDRGLVMTESRIRAWAVLAGCTTPFPSACITTSRAVFDSLLDRWPAAAELCRCTLKKTQAAAGRDSAGQTPSLAGWIEEQAFADDFSARESEPGVSAAEAVKVTICGIRAQSLRQVFGGVPDCAKQDGSQIRSDPPNFLFGLIESP